MFNFRPFFKKSFHARHSAPQAEFVARTEARFLSAYREQFPHARRPRTRGIVNFARGFAAGIALMAVVSGVAAYADQNNVGPESFLYPLKRSHEAVNITLANDEEKPALHLKFAERRLAEIQQVKTEAPQSPRVAQLTKDLEREVEASLAVLGTNEEKTVKEEKQAEVKTSNEAETEIENEKEERHALEPAVAPMNVLVPRTTREGKNENAVLSQKKEDKKASRSEKRAKVCRSLGEFITNDNLEINLVLDRTPGIWDTFQKQCEEGGND